MINYQKYLSAALLLLVFILTGCEEIINEINIENDDLILVSPVDAAVLPAGTIFFDWESLEGASRYRIQIASPDFQSPQQIVYDAIVQDSSGTRAQTSLEAGNYEWRVRGENGAYESPYSRNELLVE